MATGAAYLDGWWTAADGIRLHYRDYSDPAAASGRPAILCLPGLTRNARDFAALAEALSPEWRVLCPDLRGRGESGHAKDPLSYVPLTYLQDITALIDALGVARLVLIGTSLGGILTMLLAAARPGLVVGAVLNDIGPVIDEAGLARIRGYVGRGASYPTWLHAARAIAETHREAYPDYALADWIAMAKRLCRLTPQGRIAADYDLKIAEPFRQPAAAGVDLWPTLDALREVPGVLVRGGRSDILSAATAEAMLARLPRFEAVLLPRIGHAPTLDEPEARDAIARLLDAVAGVPAGEA